MSTEVATNDCTVYEDAVPNPTHTRQQRVTYMNELQKQLRDIGNHLLSNLESEWSDCFKVKVTDTASPFVTEEFRKLAEIKRANESLHTFTA